MCIAACEAVAVSVGVAMYACVASVVIGGAEREEEGGEESQSCEEVSVTLVEHSCHRNALVRAKEPVLARSHSLSLET